MAKNGEAAAKPAAGQGAGLALAILLGGGLGVLLLLLLTLLISVLVWSGSVPVVTAGILLTIAAGLCGRVAVKKGSGGSFLLGCGAGALICLVLLLVCLATSGMDGFHEQFIGILLMTLAGGCLAGLLGKPKKRKKKKA